MNKSSQSSIKILAIAGGSYMGGSEVVTLEVLKGLKKKGYLLKCMTNGWNDGEFHDRLRQIEIPYQSLKLGWFYIRKPTWTVDTLVHLPTALKDAGKLLKQDFNLIYTNSYRQIALLCSRINQPVLFHVHESIGNDRQFRLLKPFLEKKITKYIAVSNCIAHNLLSVGIPESKIEVIYNGIHPVENAFEKKNLQKKVITFGIVGQIIPRKGHEDLINSLLKVRNAGYSDFQLYIVGNGNKYFISRLKSLIRESSLNNHVVWKGFQKEKSEIYQNIDILIAPTRNEEPFGMVALEANSLGIPVIASNTGGLKEIIEDGNNGWLIPPKNVESLTSMFIQLLGDREQIILMGDNGKKIIQEKFSASKQIDKIHATIQSLI